MSFLKGYQDKGLVKAVHPNFRQIEQQILRAEKDLKTYSLVVKADPEWASSIVYQGMIRMGRALLFSFGFLPSDGAQHKTVVELTGRILGTDFDIIVKQFDRLRRKRNVFFYDAEDAHNFTEAKKAFETAQTLLKQIKKEVKVKNPQYGFQF